MKNSTDSFYEGIVCGAVLLVISLLAVVIGSPILNTLCGG